MNKQTADKAAKWWADQLRRGAKLDNGDTSDTGFMTLMLATMLQDQTRDSQGDELIDAFERELSNLLQDKNGRVIFGVDYNPDVILSEAARLAELPLSMASLPWKTTMMIYGDSVEVSHGYRASMEAI